MRDLGRALVKTHDYKRAISYYLESLKDFGKQITSQNIISYYEIANDFINIMFKLASTDLKKNINLNTHIDNFIIKLEEDLKKNDSHILKRKLSNFKFIRSKVLKCIFIENKSENSADIFNNLQDALKLNKEVTHKLKELKNEQAVKEEKIYTSEIFYDIGKYYESIDPQIEFAEKAYLESVTNDPLNEK